MKKYLAEMVGTMVLVLMGCGSAVFAGNIAAACGAGEERWALLWHSAFL